jgi:hypothetical protein
MTKVVIDMSMSLDGFVAGPDDGREFDQGAIGRQSHGVSGSPDPLGRRPPQSPDT